MGIPNFILDPKGRTPKIISRIFIKTVEYNCFA